MPGDQQLCLWFLKNKNKISIIISYKKQQANITVMHIRFLIK
jgi:hypothetical protein